MQEIGKNAYAISYAIFRLGSKIANPAIKEQLEKQAVILLDAAAGEDCGKISLASKSLEYLVRLGSDVGVIHTSNAEVIIAELRAINSATALHPVHFGDIFSAGQEILFSEDEGDGISRTGGRRIDGSAIRQKTRQSDSAANSAIRQSAILDKIRQSGNCRIRDLQDILPDCSERTLRYDLQALLGLNFIERVGNGGPTVYYRIRQGVSDGQK